jgi:hypothetical protein
MTERSERLLLTLYHRGQPSKRATPQTLRHLRGYIEEVQGGFVLTELGRAHCKAVLAGKAPPGAAAAPHACKQAGQTLLTGVTHFHADKGYWPTVRELADFRGVHRNTLYKSLQRALENELVQVEGSGPYHSQRIRAAEAA